MKRVFLLALLAASPVFAQNADISGAQLLSGDADARLQSLAREAVANKRKLVISAPEYWHELILDQIRMGGGADLEIEVRDSFAEAVMVRADAGGAEAPAAVPGPEPEPVPEPPARPAVPVAQAAPAPAPRPVAPVPAPAPARPAPVPAASAPAVATTPAPRPAGPPPAAATQRVEPAPRPAAPVAAAPAATPPAAAPARPALAPAPAAQQPVAAAQPAPAAATPARTERSAEAEINAIKRRLEGSLNGGEKITRTLVAAQLEPKDVLYVREPVIAVQRRDSLRNQLYWLEGGIELRRVELRESGPNRYVVAEPVRNVDNPRLRAVRSEARDLFDAEDPARHAGERTQMERRYNGGNRIESVLSPNQLNQRDVVYVGEDLVVVVRVAGLELERYWLVGRVNLGRSELLKDGNNKYRVLQDIRQ
jgi:hypothetical protein